MNKKILKLINDLKNKNIAYSDIPIELENNTEIIQAERESGMRVFSNRGYDIISNKFFVEENIIDFTDNSILETISTTFDTFEDYYFYLQGNIYENACYYQYQFTANQIKKFKLDTKKLNYQALIDYTIEDNNYKNELLKLSNEYKNTEQIKEKCKIWITKTINCKNLKELVTVLNKFEKSKYYNYYYEDILIYYLIKDNPKKAFRILMDSINNFKNIISVEKMCLYFSTEDVLKSIDYNKNEISKTTLNRRQSKLKKFVDNIDSEKYKKNTQCRFDANSNYFIVEDSYEIIGRCFPISIKKYFYDIKEIINYVNYDLSNCDFSKAIISKDEIKGCITNENTILPLNISSEALCLVNKYYDSESENFIVSQKWKDKNGNIIHERKNSFKYFFDFVYYLKNDLSNADLIFCEGIKNLKSTRGINFNNARIRSEIMDKLGLNYELIKFPNKIISFKETVENEKNSLTILNEKKDLIKESIDDNKSYKKISYVSDIHLMHRLEKCKSIFDIEFIIEDIINNLLNNFNQILLIGGDVSSDFNLYKFFICELSKSIKNYADLKVIFILGNHELWSFENKEIEDIVNRYKNLLSSNGMYLIHNNLLYIEENQIKELSEEEINILSYRTIRNRLKRSNLIISGGLAFSGYNKEFNANNGIYRNTINRKQEIEETKKFEKLYNKLTECLKDKNVIIFTHTPKEDWSNSQEYVKNWVYVSGHTHRKYFYDDGEYRIYADNQLGYHYKKAFIKDFYIEYNYDIFSDYEDGIYSITKEEYIEFYRGKNIMMDYNRDGKIYMLKKNGYYCFIKPSKKGLAILNGGSLKSLDNNDINYYYNNMDNQILINKAPLNKYTEYQKNVANYIKKIGGLGTIHGSIIDIDFLNHIYVNPFDGTLSGYFASNIIDKYVYANIPSLLKAKCPQLFENYQKKLGKSEANKLIARGQSTEIILKPTYYSSTNMYKASMEIKKMQRLNNGILTVWHNSNKKLLS